MIIQWFAEMFYKIFTALLGWINLPHLPSNFYMIYNYVDYVFKGVGFFKLFVPSHIVRVGLPISIIIIGLKYLYQFIMWILKKIPAAGIE